jgi:hypothetical protein
MIDRVGGVSRLIGPKKNLGLVSQTVRRKRAT